jgi:uncharacterized protein (DUF952 family)
MRRIYHLVTRSAWERDPTHAYSADSLAAEGFIHCSQADQVARIANLFYSDLPELLILCIDTARLRSPLKDEMVGTEVFAHVYGPINRDAVSEVRPMLRGLDGRWTFTE